MQTLPDPRLAIIIERFGVPSGIALTIHANSKRHLREMLIVASETTITKLLRGETSVGFSFGYYVSPDAARDFKHHAFIVAKI